MGVEGGVNARRQVVQPGAAHGDEVLERALVVVVQAAAQRTGTISSGAIPVLLLPAGSCRTWSCRARRLSTALGTGAGTGARSP